MSRTIQAPLPADGIVRGDHLLLALSDVNARIDVARLFGAVAVGFGTGRSETFLDLRGPAGPRLYRLLDEATARNYDTVRISRGPHGPVVGVSRRRRRRTRSGYTGRAIQTT